MVHGDTSGFNNFFTFAKKHGTRGHNFKLYKNACHKNNRKFSFSFRVVDFWNNLSFNTVNACDINTFKKLLDWDFDDKIFNFD